jgi:small GTP-binding protein
MIKKKVCVLGAYAVGKTSLIKRFVESLFSEKYLTTVGVKIDKKTVQYNGEAVTLMLWDIQGEDSLNETHFLYLRGLAGCILVIDGTRADTLETAIRLEKKAREIAGDTELVCAVNKSDLVDEWELEESALEELREKGWDVFKTSAKDGSEVENLFHRLTDAMLAKERAQ